MKVFASIIAIFFMYLSVLPCADNQDNHQEIIVSSADHNHEHAADDCAPFCYCNCCHVHATLQIANQDFSEFSKNYKPISQYSDYITHIVSSTIFRPPIV